MCRQMYKYYLLNTVFLFVCIWLVDRPFCIGPPVKVNF